MEFALSDNQLSIRESVGRALDKHCSVELLHRFAASGEPAAAEIWRILVELGIPALLIPEEYGGMGLSLLDAAVVAEELGRRAVPAPFIAAAVMGPLAVTAAGTPEQCRRLLPQVAKGLIRLGVAVSERAAGARERAGVTATHGRLSGKTLFALDSNADLFVVGDETGRLHLVAADATGLTRRILSTVDVTRCVAELVFDNVAAESLQTAEDDSVTVRIIDAGRVMLAADMLGAGQMMLDMAVAYAKERRQFGRVIGSFQAVKHLCAEMAAELEPARALVWYSAYAFDHRPAEAALMAAHAKAHVSEVGRFVARTAIEVHGGIGFTDLLGLHYWFKRIDCGRQWLGGPQRLRREAARLQGLGA